MGDLKKLFVVTEAHEWDNPPEPQSGMDPRDVHGKHEVPEWLHVQLDQIRKAFSDLEVAVGSGDMFSIGKLAYKISHLAERITQGSEP